MPLFGRKQSDRGGPPTRALPRGFGLQTAWLAISSVDPGGVAQALGLQSVQAIAWEQGLAAMRAADPQGRSGAVFVTPAVDGWVLCPFSLALADLSQFDLSAVSRKFGEAQRFLTNHTVEIHQWERWRDGELLRQYGFDRDRDEVLFEEGAPTEPEMRVTPGEINEDFVLEMAAMWSIDPETLHNRVDIAGEGWIGFLNVR
jgi:hypothetical protein